MDVADRVCDLECIGKGKSGKEGYGRHEFVGPVRIILVESTPIDYNRKIWGSAVFTFIMMLMGATFFTVFLFTLAFKLPILVNLHVLLCTLGFQLFMTNGILMFSSLFGGAMHLKPTDRKFQHFLLEIFGLLTGLVGTGLIVTELKYTWHGITGLSGALLAIMSSLIGPTAYFTSPEKMLERFNMRWHRVFAIPTFILCTTCFILGIMKESFIKWLPIKNLQYMLIAFTVLSSVATLVSTPLRAMYGT